MFAHKTYDAKYDNRFGFSKYCKAYWIFDIDCVGERFIFKFPNGVEVSVIRTTHWNYHMAASNSSFACSYGFAFGLYEALVYAPDQSELDQEGYMDYTDVHKLLSKYRNWQSEV